MNTNDLYYKKYLKYKSKYLELRGSSQIGGLKPCPFFKLLTSPYELIKSHDCKYPQLEEKFKDFTYTEYLAANIRHPTKQITIQELKEKDFPLSFFMERGYPVRLLITAYQLQDFITYDFTYTKFTKNNKNHPSDQITIQELKDKDFPLTFFMERGYPVRLLTPPIYTLQDFIDADYTPVTYSLTTMDSDKKWTWSLEDLINIGFSATEIRSLYSSPEKLQNDFNTICERGIIPLSKILPLGFSLKELIKWQNIKDFKGAGVSLKDLKSAGFTLKQLDKNYTILEYMDAGYSDTELLYSDFDYYYLINYGLSNERMLKAISNDDKVNRGSPGWKKADFILSKSNTDATIRNLIENDFILLLKENNKSAADLKKNGATLEQLLKARFDATQLKNAGIDIVTLKVKGFDASQLKKAGFDASQLKNADFSVAELKAVGFSASELNKAGFSVVELKTGGFPVSELKSIGISVDKLKSAGFTASEFKSIGISVGNLKSAGFTASELKMDGYSASDLRSAGFDVAALKSAGFTASELKSAEFTASEL